MDQTKYTIVYEEVSIEGETKWKGGYEKREPVSNGFTSETEYLGGLFDTKGHATDHVYDYLTSKEIDARQIFEGE